MNARWCSANDSCTRGRPGRASWSRGPTSSTTRHGRGRSSPPVGSAICWRSSSSRRVNTWWISRRCWRAGAAVGQRPVGQERSERCPVGRDRRVAGIGVGAGAGRGPRDGVADVGAPAHADRPGRGTRPRVGSMRSSCELVPGGISKELVVSQAFRLLETIEPVGAVATERHRLASRARRRHRPLRHATQSIRGADPGRGRGVGHDPHRDLRDR